MSGGLTEEQRQRIEANRQKALQKKNQRQQLQNRNAGSYTFDYNEAPSSNHVPIPPSFDYNEISRNENDKSLARESFGDSSIDWNEVIAFEGQINNSVRECSQVQKNKRKLDKVNEQNSQPSMSVSNSINSTADNHSSRDSSAPSNLTEDQRIRIETNRLRALEKKQRAANNSTASSSQIYSALNSSSVVRTSSTSSGSSTLAHTKPHIRRDQQTDIEMGKSQHAAHKNSNTSLLTDEQRALIEKKRLLALKKKQSSTMVIENHTTIVPSSAVCTGDSQFNTVPKLTEEQRNLIEMKRLAALQRKQSLRISQTKPLSLPIQSSNQYSLTKQDDVNTVSSNAEQFASLESSDAKCDKCIPSVNDAQPAAFIESKRHTAPLERCSLEQHSSAGYTSNHVASLKSDKEPVELLTRNTQHGQYKVAPDAKSEEQIDIKPVPPSPNKNKQGDLGLPKIPLDLQYEAHRCLPIEDDHSDSLVENAELDKPLLNGWMLYDHQKEGVVRALRMRRLILAFDMGLGKTIIGCVWSKAFIKAANAKVFVISPVSLIEDWSRTANGATGLITSDAKKKPKKKKKDQSADDASERTPDMYIFSWSSVAECKSIITASPVDCKYVVIADEAHNMQSMTAKRTADALKLILGKKCIGVLLLSGTPMKNGKPSNLFPLLRAVKHPFGDDQRKYEFFFCNGHYRRMNGKEVWDASGSSNLNELHAHTNSHIFRKTKDECMSKELPPKRREYLKVPVASRQKIRYEQALKELANAYEMQSANSEIGSDAYENKILEPFNRLRQASSIAKVDAAVGLANDILKEEGSIVIFTSYVAVAEEIKAKLEEKDWSGQLLTGEVVAHKRQQMVDEFQEGVTPVFVCTYGAGGVGITLTAACTVILVDRPWTPGDVNQAEDRVRRIGQTRPVRSIWIRAFPIDEQIDSLIDHKEVNSSTAVDGLAGTGQNKAAPKICIAELVKTALTSTSTNPSDE